mgnify:CR=1 FL=1
MNKFQYKMTVIMPSYNNGQYIRQALDSILMQEVDFNYQIIITDDCSQDDSPNIIKEYEHLYPDRVLALYSDRNCRLFQNVLKALRQMDSEYFCVLDPDDYWTDKKHLQKAVDFFDENPEYTIYGTNAYKLYLDGTEELYYNHLGITEYTSTYEDYLKGTSILSNTFGSTYRNVYFTDGIPDEYLRLKGTKFEEMFRADSARNLIHLKRGKAYFANESIGYSRRFGKGLGSSLKEYERHITVAYANVGFFEFFGRENEADFERIIRNKYIVAVKTYLQTLVSGEMSGMMQQYKEYFSTVMEWLQLHQTALLPYTRVPFSLERFSEMSLKKTIIWGTGRAAARFISQYHIPIHEDTFFIDSDEKKQGKSFMGRLIKCPIALKDESDALLVIASSYYKEIIMQIIMQELCPVNRIINIYDYERDRV